ncbi:uncharacterized protein LOC101862431 [Aplysia californica]|uniref:Uncharacterized protein LOC101862431 n=1 Tax=Aplysia californica TaxID=6500 RepID=A0ABM1VXG0_APLCA|nr:uncharacterized protein LOC101862431 [Aplysia californica]XP_035827103.1 uncharacterized protein LOC101862431 [Aplysia californica]
MMFALNTTVTTFLHAALAQTSAAVPINTGYSASTTTSTATTTTTTTATPPSFPYSTPSSDTRQNFSDDYNRTNDLLNWIEDAKSALAPYILVFGIVNNVLTLLTLRQPKLKESPYTYLTALAVADLSALILILIREQEGPSWSWSIYTIYIFYPLVNVAATLGIWVMVLMTLERCIVIHFAFWAHAHCTRYNARVKVVVVFVASVIVNFPRFLWYYVGEPPDTDTKAAAGDSAQAARNVSVLANMANSTEQSNHGSSLASLLGQYVITNSSSTAETPAVTVATTNSTTLAQPKKYVIQSYLYNTEFSRVVTWAHSVLLNFLPVVLLLIFNSFLVYKYKMRSQHERRKKLGIHDNAETMWTREQTRLTVTLIAIVCLFIILVLPSAFADQHVAILFFPTDSEKKNLKQIRIYQHVTNFLMWLNLSLNFLMYSFINAKFRRAFKRMVRQWVIYLRLDRLTYVCRRHCCRLSSGKGSQGQSTCDMEEAEEMAPFNNNWNNRKGHNAKKASNYSVSSKDNNSVTLSLKLDTSVNGQLA